MFFSKIPAALIVLLTGCASGLPTFQQSFIDTQRGLNSLSFTVTDGDVAGSSADWYDGQSTGLKGELLYDEQGCLTGELHADGTTVAEDIAANNNTAFVMLACPGELLQTTIIWGDTEFDMDFVAVPPCDDFFVCDQDAELDTGHDPFIRIGP